MNAPSSSLLAPRNLAAFITVSLIWGSTWLVIRDQISAVPAQWSVTYRFAVAALGMLFLCLIKREPLALTRVSWGMAGLVALFQFVLNFTLVYRAEGYITSGLVAVIFALLVVPSAILGKIFLGQEIGRNFVMGSLLATGGIALLFTHEYIAMGEAPGKEVRILTGVAFCLGGLLAAAIAGTLLSSDKAKKVPLTVMLFYAMAMGAALNASAAFILYGPPVVEARAAYIMGTLYLGLVGSVATFPLYFGLMRKVGVGRAAYVNVCIPVVAMALSTLFEGYQWGALSVLGSLLALSGMVWAMRARNPSK